MRKIMLRFTAGFDQAAITEFIQRALLASQSGAVLESLDLSKTSAVQLQAYAVIALPEEVKAEDVERWLTSQLQQAPSIPILGQLVEPESRRLDAEAKVGGQFVVLQVAPAEDTQGASFVYRPHVQVDIDDDFDGFELECPRCGNPIPLATADLDKDGTVAGDVRCPFGCGFQSAINLKGAKA